MIILRCSALLVIGCLTSLAQIHNATRQHDETWTFAVSVCADAKNTLSTCSEQGRQLAEASMHVPYAPTSTPISSQTAINGGWPVLKVRTQADTDAPSELLLRAAGYAEGYLTHEYIWDMVRRVAHMRKPSTRAALRDYIATQWENILSGNAVSVGNYKNNVLAFSAYKQTLKALTAQVLGMHEGYQAAAPQHRQLQLIDILELNYDGDAFDIIQAVESGVASFAPKRDGAYRFRSSRQQVLHERAPADYTATTQQQQPAYPLTRMPRDTDDLDAWVTLSRHGHCTAVIVAKEGGPDGVSVWAGHNTWADYTELNRIFKVYTLHISTHTGERDVDKAKEPLVSLFSSYPGMVASTDDWYELSSGLLITETTLAAVDARALTSIHPARGLPSWLRVGVANVAAVSAADWVAVFDEFSAGTYNCMWMVLDAQKIVKARQTGQLTSLQTLPDGSLMIYEQSSTTSSYSDITTFLRQNGVWVSANRPFTAAVRRDLGYPGDMEAQGTRDDTTLLTHSTIRVGNTMARFQQVFGRGEESDPADLEPLRSARFAPRSRGGEVLADEPSHLARFREDDTDEGKEQAAKSNKAQMAFFSHCNNPRGRILLREAQKIRTVQDMEALLRLNTWQSDAFSLGKPYLAVAARYDLAAPGDSARSANGAIDAKVAEVADVVNLRVHTSLGPTAVGVPPFDWKAWTGQGFCGAEGMPCAEGLLDVNTLCGHTTAALHGTAPLILPCKWSSGYAVIKAN